MRRLIICDLAVLASAAPAHADVTISANPTENMTCSAGVCAPTADDAVLNVGDLQNLLASGNVSVTTTGAGGVQAANIDVAAPATWSSANGLALDAYESTNIGAAISVAGAGALSITTNDGGSGGAFSISGKGHIVFQNLSSQLTINGNTYVLVNSIASLQSAINSNPFGFFALSVPYDAAGDGTYATCPITAQPLGTFDGLGNSISNVSIDFEQYVYFMGFFCGSQATIEHFGLQHIDIVTPDIGDVGTLAGFSGGYLFEDFATGTIRVGGHRAAAGGLVGAIAHAVSDSAVDHCYADVKIDGRKMRHGFAGGLIAYDPITPIYQSFATGTVIAGRRAQAGGLIGWNDGGTIENSYALGAVTGESNSQIGGLVGRQGNQRAQEIDTSYSTGAVSGGASSFVGGFAGTSTKISAYNSTYWDTTTSGTDRATGKGNSNGIAGETTAQLQSGLPTGFDPAIWAETPAINGGLPYLIANPPRK